MRILHTADWHLCDRLGRNDRTLDLQQRVEQVAAICLEKDVELLVIAGDLFSEQASVEQMTAALLHIRHTFFSFFARGGTILAVTGNHDRNSRIEIVRAGMSLAVPDANKGGLLSGGRMYLVNSQAVVRLVDRDGNPVQFVLLPYPYPSRYNVASDRFKTKEEENREVRGAVSRWLASKPNEQQFDQSLPTVLIAHLHVRGSELTTAYKMTDQDDILFDVGELHPDWRYVALGHIHKPQCLSGSETVRYSGSLDRLDFGETHDNHAVLVFDVRGVETVNVERIPIAATPFYTITLTDPEVEIPTLAAKYPDHQNAIVVLKIQPLAGEIDREEIGRQLKRLFPRWHTITWLEPERSTTDETETMKYDPRAALETTVRAYLTSQLVDDADAGAVLELAETFLTQGAQS